MDDDVMRRLLLSGAEMVFGRDACDMVLMEEDGANARVEAAQPRITRREKNRFIMVVLCSVCVVCERRK